MSGQTLAKALRTILAVLVGLAALAVAIPLLVMSYLEAHHQGLDKTLVEVLVTWRAWATAIVLTGGVVLLTDQALQAPRGWSRWALWTLDLLALSAHVVLAAPAKIAAMLDGVELVDALATSTLIAHPGVVLFAVVSVAAPDLIAAALAVGLAVQAEGARSLPRAPSAQASAEADEALIKVAGERNALEARLRTLTEAIEALGLDPEALPETLPSRPLGTLGSPSPPETTLEPPSEAPREVPPGSPSEGPVEAPAFTRRCPKCEKPFTKPTAEKAEAAVSGHLPHCKGGAP